MIRYIPAAMFAAAAACFVAAWLCARPAHGAEQRRWEIVLTERPTAAEPDRVRTFTISEAYATKDDCLRVLSSVRVRAPGAKVRCLPKED